MSASLTLICEPIGSRHQFGPNGGAFGRSRKCDWVLPDPDRHLSSIHARILYQNDTFVLVDESTNGTFLEGQPAPVGRGRAVSLSPGMKLRAGPYQIGVESIRAGAAAQTSPFTTMPAKQTTAAAVPLRIDTSGASHAQSASLDPLDHLGGGQAETLRPVASVQVPQAGIPEPVAYAAPVSPPHAHDMTRFQPAGHSGPELPAVPQLSAPIAPDPVIPGGLPVSALPPIPAPQPTVRVETPAAAQTPSDFIPEDFLSALTGARTPAPPTPSAPVLPNLADLGDPPVPAASPYSGFPAGPTGGASRQGQPARILGNIDPGLKSAASASAVPPLPQPVRSPSAPHPDEESAEPPLNPVDALRKRREQREVELAQKARSQDLPAGPVNSVPPNPAMASPIPRSAMPARNQAIPGPAASSGTVSDPAVFQALLAGLGFSDAAIDKDEQAEIARAAGEMVQELANGLIALLNARKSLKTEFRMYETRIQPEENNPFKHFNVGELALDEMLFARQGGFLAPAEAAREAFKDLQSHTMLTVAATQRAMRLLFESLSPETLAGEEDDGGLRLKGLGSRRGKWDAAKEKHDRLRADFDAVIRQTIAEAFVQIEEEQVRQQSKTFWENRKK